MSTSYHELTKADVAALRQCDTVSVHYSAIDPSVTGIVCTKRLERKETEPFADTERRVTIGAGAPPVGVAYCYDRDFTRARCFALVYNYPSQHDQTSSVIATLRAGDSVAFEFYPDAGSNGYCAEAGLHIDRLYLRVRRNGKDHASWCLTSGCSLDNSSRMCRDIPNSKSYESDRRRLASV